MVRPALGGHLYELDFRPNAVNLLATLERRPELYHRAIMEAIERQNRDQPHDNVTSNGHERLILKQEGLDRLMVYDRSPRKALVDHLYPIEVSLDDLAACRDVEKGDFVTGTYLAKVQRDPRRVAVVMERPGHADGHSIRIKKTIELRAGSPALEVLYELTDLPARGLSSLRRRA